MAGRELMACEPVSAGYLLAMTFMKLLTCRMNSEQPAYGLV